MKANIKDALMYHLRGVDLHLSRAADYLRDGDHPEIRAELQEHAKALNALYSRLGHTEVTPDEPCACTHSDHFITCKHHRWPAS